MATCVVTGDIVTYFQLQIPLLSAFGLNVNQW